MNQQQVGHSKPLNGRWRKASAWGVCVPPPPLWRPTLDTAPIGGERPGREARRADEQVGLAAGNNPNRIRNHAFSQSDTMSWSSDS